MRYNLNARCDYFAYKREICHSGTKLVYNGKCHLNESEVILNNKLVTFLYCENGKDYFQDGNKIYTCPTWEFENRIVKIVKDIKPIQEQLNIKTEFYWTDAMVTKTIWYVIIMLVAVIFNDCIGIWILATIVWYNSVFNNKK